MLRPITHAWLVRIQILASLPAVAACAVRAGRPAAPSSLADPAVFSQADAPCTLRLPDALGAHASVKYLPEELYRRALAPVVRALCACTQPGDRLTTDVRILPDRGEVRATAADSAGVDACLAANLAAARFERVAVPTGACVDCGPRHVEAPARPARLAHFGMAAPPGARPSPALVVVYPLLVDRPAEQLREQATLRIPPSDLRE
jgi:hypothetical protein